MYALEITFVNTRDAIISLAVLLGALAAIGRYIVMPVVRFGRRLERVMSNVEQQLYPNGGKSLRDAVNRIQRHLGIDDDSPDDNPNHPTKKR